MGRSSSRIATRRIANYNGDELDQLIEATGIIYPKAAEPPALHASLSTSSLTSSTSSTTASSLYVTSSSSSSSSTTMLNSYDQYFKQPASKKRRLQPLTKSATTILPVQQAQANQKSNNAVPPMQTSLSNALHGHAPTTAAGGYLMESYAASSALLKPTSSIYSASAVNQQSTASSTNN